MAIARERKEQLVREYGDRLARAQVAIWAEFRGVDVAQMSNLRRQLRAVGAEAVVVRNTLMRLALAEQGLPTDVAWLDGSNAVTFLYDDVAAGAKALTGFASANERALSIKGALAGARLLDPAQVRALSTLPSREELLAKLLGNMQAPIGGLVGTLSSLLRSLLVVLNARAQQLEGSGS